jgi:Kef-type K+ transport system membrane component KefB
LQDILRNLQEIIRSEFRLAKTEFKEEATRAAKPAATFGAGLVLGLYGIGFLLLASVYALSTLVAAWIASLLVGLALALVAVALITSSSKRLKRIDPRPDKTIRSLQENVQWAKHPIK